jgi:hypothetical protein
MVRTVEVDAVPAGREEGLCSETETWLSWEAIGVWRIGRSQAYVLYGLLREA